MVAQPQSLMIPSLLTKNMEQVASILRDNFLALLAWFYGILLAKVSRPAPPLGRDKSGPYGGGIASLAGQGWRFANGIRCVMAYVCRHFLGWDPDLWCHSFSFCW